MSYGWLTIKCKSTFQSVAHADQNLWQRRTLQAFLEKAEGTASVLMFVSCQQHEYSSEAGIPAEKMNIGSCTESMCVVFV